MDGGTELFKGTGIYGVGGVERKGIPWVDILVDCGKQGVANGGRVLFWFYTQGDMYKISRF